MAQPDVIGVGASAGGVEALRALVGGLPADLPAAVLVVLHVPRSSPSALPQILDRAGPLAAAAAVDGEELRHGRIYIAPADRHLLVIDNRIRLSHGPAENGHRPAVDPMFRSLARAFGPRAVGVVLSGARDDGAAGLAAIADRGGYTIVQEPDDALHPSMPRAAMDQVTPDQVLPAAKIGAALGELAELATGRPAPVGTDALLEAEVAMSDMEDVTTDQTSAEPAGYGCPSCGGGLFELGGTPVPRYRCRVGHAWSPESLLDEQAIALEGALWMALRALKEKSELSRRLAVTHWHPDGIRSARYQALADDANTASDLIRNLIERLGSASDADADAATAG